MANHDVPWFWWTVSEAEGTGNACRSTTRLPWWTQAGRVGLTYEGSWDYRDPSVTVNVDDVDQLGGGAMTSNIPDVFGPGAHVVAYTFTAADRDDLGSWGSLVLVFASDNTLVGVVGDRWTI